MIFKMQCEIGVAIYPLHAYYKSPYVIFRINAQKRRTIINKFETHPMLSNQILCFSKWPTWISMQQNKLLQGAGLWVLRYSLHLKICKTINMYTWMLTV